MNGAGRVVAHGRHRILADNARGSMSGESRSSFIVHRSSFKYWWPAILWAAFILFASTDLFSAEHTGSILESVITTVIGHPLSVDQFTNIHFLVRKTAHVTEYGILGALFFRALRGERRGWIVRWAALAVLMAAGVASLDEWHQAHVPSRTGTPIDVLLDAAGATVAQVAIRVAQVLF